MQAWLNKPSWDAEEYHNNDRFICCACVTLSAGSSESFDCGEYYLELKN